MATLHEVRQRIEQLRQEARTLNTSAGDGALDPAAETRFAAIEAEVVTLRTAERRAEWIDGQDRATPGAPVGEDRRFDELRSGVSLSAVIRAQMRDHRDSREAGVVREVSAELARRSGRAPANGLLFDMRTAPEARTLTTGKQATTPNGAALVSLMQRPAEFSDVLRRNLVIEQAGARVLTDLVGDVSIPRRVTSVQPAFVNENAPLPLSDTTFDQLLMRPKTAGVVSEISRNMVLQSSPSAEALVMDDQAKTLAQLIDLAALLGDGVGAMPFGMIPQATARTYPAAGAPSYDDVLGALDTLEALNIQPSGWVIGNGVRRKLMAKPRSTTLSEGFIMEDRNSLIGLPVLQTGNMTAGGLLIGDFSELCVGYWSAVEIVVNEFAQDAFMRGNVLVRAIVTMDVLVRRPTAFVKLTEAVA